MKIVNNNQTGGIAHVERQVNNGVATPPPGKPPLQVQVDSMADWLEAAIEVVGFDAVNARMAARAQARAARAAAPKTKKKGRRT